MKIYHHKMIAAVFFTVTLLASCTPGERRFTEEAIKSATHTAQKIHPPPNLIKNGNTNSAAAESITALIKASGQKAERARELDKAAKMAGEDAVRNFIITAPSEKRTIDQKSLWEVAYDTVYKEIKKRVESVAEKELKEYAEKKANEIVADMISSQALNQNLDTSGNGTTSQQHQPNQSANTNAVIVGEPGSKNIRTGPGTNNGVMYSANPGDRVQILETGQDQGGYPWYKVNFPNSGVNGWIAAQLIKPD